MADMVGPVPVIKLGWRLRLGMLVPSVNTVAEPQLNAMLPCGVSLHTTRLKLTGSTDEELRAMADRVEEASLLLADAEPQRILFNCTAVTTFDATAAGDICARITRATGLPAHATAEAMLAALRALGAKRIVMITPYIAPVAEREVAFLNHHGIDVLREHSLGLPGGKAFATVEPTEWYRIATSQRHAGADAYFLSCAQARTAEIIEALEFDLGRPVLTSNQVLLWHSLRSAGLADRIPGFGALLRR